MTAALRPLVLLLLSPGAALAQDGCVTADMLDAGLRLTYADGATEVYRRAGPAEILVVGAEADGYGYEFRLAQGYVVTEFVQRPDGRPDPSTRVTYDPGIPASELPVPVAGGRSTFAMTVTDAMGSRTEAQNVAIGTSGTVVIGGCTYASLPVLVAYDTPDFYVEGLVWLPELGFAYMEWFETVDLPRAPIAAVSLGPAK